MLRNQIVLLLISASLVSGCNVKVSNQANLARLKAAGPDISVFDVPSTKLQAGAALNIPFTITPSEYTEVSQITLQYASDGVNFIDVAPVDPNSSAIVWNVPKTEVANAKLQLTATSSTGKSSQKQSSSFSTSLNPLNASLFSVSSANPTGSTSALFTVSDCTNRVSIYASESKITPRGNEKNWTTCSTTLGSISFTLSSNEGIKTVYFWTKDKDENISEPVPIQVTLDKTGPALSFTNAPLSGASLTGGSVYALGFTAVDSVSGLANIKVQYSSDGGVNYSDLATLASTTTSYNWVVPTLAVSSAKVRITAQDNSGNSSTLASSGFSIALLAPTVSITSPLANSYVNSSNVASYAVSGACSAQGGSVSVSAADGSTTVTGSTTCDLLSTPNWSVSLNLSTLNNTTINLSATHANLASISTTSSTVSVTKDSSSPILSFTTPTVLNPINASNVSSFDATGSCSENGASVSISASDGTNSVSTTATCNTGGTPNFSTTLNLTSLLDGTITFSASQSDLAGNSGSAATVSVTKDVSIPVVVSVSSSTSSGTYIVGGSVSIQVNFSKVVNVTGTPQLTIATGSISTSRTLSYVSGTGSNALTFTYTVQNGDYSSQLNYLNTTSLALNSGTIQDAATNNATLTLPATGSTLSLAGTSTTASKTIKVNSATPAQSTLATSLGAGTCTTASSCKKTQTTNLVLTTQDSANNPMTLGGLTVTFSTSTGAGVSTGTIGATTDHGDGTYSALFTATGSGTATTITATITGLGAVTSTTTIIVTNAAPVITPLATKTYPLDGGSPPTIQGSSVTLATATDADSDTITLSCTYKTLGLHSSDPNYAAAGTNCSNLDTITSSGSPATTVTGKLIPTSTGSLSWTPTYTQRGTYEFTINGTDGVANSTPQTVTITARGPYTTTNLLSALDALNATNASGLSLSTPSAPFTTSDSAGSCLNLLSSASNGSLTFGTTNPWTGTGQTSISSVDPYRLSFRHTASDSLSLGTALSTATQFSTETWVKPSPLPSASPAPIIVGNGGATGNGFVLRQSQITPDRAEFVVGQKYYSYRDLVLSDKPIAYWRLGEIAGTTASDLSAYASDGTYGGGYSLNQTGLISGDSDKSVSFDGTAYITPSEQAIQRFSNGSSITIEAWIKPTAVNAYRTIVTKGRSSGLQDANYTLRVTDGYVQFFYRNSADTYWPTYTTTSALISDNQTYHIAVTYTYGTAASAIVYVNGAVAAGSWTSGSGSETTISTTNPIRVGAADSPDAGTTEESFSGIIDDLAIYNYTLTSSQLTEHYQTGLNGNYKVYPGNAILADKPLGYWRLGERTGSAARDSSGNGNNGTFMSGTSLNQTGALSVSGDASASTLFNGGTQAYVNLGNISALKTQFPFTLETWFRFTSGGRVNPLIGTDQYDSTLYCGATLFVSSSNILALNLSNCLGGNSSPYRFTKSGTTVLSANTWHHVVITVIDTSNINFYIDGQLDNGGTTSGAATTIGYSSYPITIGANTGTFFLGYLSETTIYNYPLSTTQVANHYNSGNGAGWWTCQSQTQMNNSNWNLLSTLYDGTTAKLFVNGQQECSVTPGTTYSGAVANTVVGSNPGRTSNFWTGVLSSLKIFGTSNGSAPASTSSIKANFDSEANQYRTVPIENIVTNGLVLNLDAANAKQGLAPYSNGCASSDLNWFDLSASSFIPTLINFSSCSASSGWVGNGTVANPYALALDGTNDYVPIPNSTSLNLYPMTISVWFKTTMNTANYPGIVSNYSAANGYNFYFNNGKICAWYYKNGSSRIYSGDTTSLCTAGFNNGAWHHASYVVGPSGGTLYVDGTQVSTLAWIGTPGATSSSLNVVIGNYSGNVLPGSLATLQIYDRNLSAQEVKQNCLAQEKRFTNTPQSICAAP
jgi:hypothetical protein